MRPRTAVLLAAGLATALALPLLIGTSATASPAGPVRRAAAPAAAAAAAADTKLMVRYAVRNTCTVYPNYPKPGVVGNSGRTWRIPQGKSLIWRYNVNRDWALVSDPSRARRTFPWWGFTRRDCIGRSIRQADYPAGKPVPTRILEGRSRQGAHGWRRVDFSVAPAPVVRRHRLTSTATLRDPVNFAIGNAFPGWTVEVTGRTRSNGHWVLVHLPNAERWGYMEADNLH
jgi:hypothetical protein